MKHAVGQRIPRRDARLQVSGKSVYGDDLTRPNLLHARFVYSKYPHAKILNVDLSRAKKVKGVHAIITAKDIHENDIGFSHIDQQVFRTTKVNYPGDTIAAIAAETIEAANEAVSVVDVDYEPLPFVTDVIEAMKPGAPIIHGDSNTAYYMKIRKGDIEQGLQQSDEIIEETFSTPRIQHCHLEPHVGLAEVDDQGRLVVISSTQRVFLIANFLSKILNIPESKIVVRSPAVGGGFGSKTEISIEPAISLLAIKTKRPVKMVLTREEEFKSTPIRHPMVATYKTGVKKDGTIVARQIKLVYDTGAYVSQGKSVLAKASINSAGPYNIPNVWLDGYLVYTNTNFGSAMRGFGVPQVAFAYESHTDTIAKTLGMDPIEFRLKNFIADNSSMPTGQVLESVVQKETLMEAMKLAGWEQEAYS